MSGLRPVSNLSVQSIAAKYRTVQRFIDHSHNRAQDATSRLVDLISDAGNERVKRLLRFLLHEADPSAASACIFPESGPVLLFLRGRVQARCKVQGVFRR